MVEVDNNIPTINLPQVFDFTFPEECTEVSYAFEKGLYTEVLCKVSLAQYGAGFAWYPMFDSGNFYEALGAYTSTKYHNGIYIGSYTLHYQLKSNNRLKLTVTSDMQMSWREDWGTMGIPSGTERSFEFDLPNGFNKVGMKFKSNVVQAPPFHITVWAK